MPLGSTSTAGPGVHTLKYLRALSARGTSFNTLQDPVDALRAVHRDRDAVRAFLCSSSCDLVAHPENPTVEDVDTLFEQAQSGRATLQYLHLLFEVQAAFPTLAELVDALHALVFLNSRADAHLLPSPYQPQEDHVRRLLAHRTPGSARFTLTLLEALDAEGRRFESAEDMLRAVEAAHT